MRKKTSINIAIVNDRGKIRIFWRYEKKPYSISPRLDYNEDNIQLAAKVVKLISKNLLRGNFDLSLNRYKAEFKLLVEGSKGAESASLKREIKGAVDSPLVKEFEYWAINYRHKNCEEHSHYNATRNLLKRWGNFKLEDALGLFNKGKFAVKTYNNRLTMLQAFFTWAVKYKKCESNPFDDVPTKKIIGSRKVNPKRVPFTSDEIHKILDAIKIDTYVNEKSGYKHSHYYPFLYFMFKTGVRNAEAIGLRVKHIDFDNGQVKIEEVLARTLSRTNANARVRKETKNGKIRKFPLDDELKDVLVRLVQNKQPDDLVFQSYRGLPIDDRMFQQRVLIPVMEKLKIPIRDLYAARHSFATRAIANDINPVVLAFMMGNNPETALKNYVHNMDLPQSLPIL